MCVCVVWNRSHRRGARTCREIHSSIESMEIAQVGVRTRARAALAMGAASSAARTPKKRKINNRNEEPKFSTASSQFVQLKSRSRRRSAAVDKPETTATVLPAPEPEEHSTGPISDEFPASCCSSNGSVGLDEERMIKSVDLEVREIEELFVVAVVQIP